MRTSGAARLGLLTRTSLRDDDGVPYGADHTKACARHAEDGSDGLDELLAPPGNMHLGEAIECEFKSHQIVHPKQRADRQFRELG